MNSLSLTRVWALAGLIAALGMAPSRADDNVASLSDVHQLLLKAACDADNPPAADQQKDILAQALAELRKVSHVYHGEIKKAKQDLETALDELSSGNGAQHARTDILDADDRSSR